MATYSVDSDTVIDVYHIGSKSSATGFQSRYTDIEHPGSNKKIQGWQWDRRVWPTPEEPDTIDYPPSIVDS